MQTTQLSQNTGQQNNQGVFDSYVVQKMYNFDELANFASTETRLK